MDIAEFKSRLKDKKTEGIFIFAGEEEYLVRYYLGELRRGLEIDQTFAVFNNPVFDGGEVNFDQLFEAVKSPPMMSDYKLIEWRRADFSAMKEKELAQLSELIELVHEHSYSVVAFTAEGDRLDFGTAKKPSKFMLSYDKKINIIRFERSSENQLYSWLKKHFDALGIEVNMEVLRALVFRVGRSMDVLLSEVEKLSYLALSRGKNIISTEDIAEVCISSPESDTFALSNAISSRNKQAAFSALDELKSRRIDPKVIFGMISRTFDDILAVSLMLSDGEGLSAIEAALKGEPYRMTAYKLKLYAAAAKRYSPKALTDITAALAKADADSKYGGVSGYTAIELFLSRSL